MTANEVLMQYKNGERNFRGCAINGQRFAGQNLSNADFCDADIRGTDFKNAILTKAKFTGSIAGQNYCWSLILSAFLIFQWLAVLILLAGCSLRLVNWLSQLPTKGANFYVLLIFSALYLFYLNYFTRKTTLAFFLAAIFAILGSPELGAALGLAGSGMLWGGLVLASLSIVTGSARLVKSLAFFSIAICSLLIVGFSTERLKWLPRPMKLDHIVWSNRWAIIAILLFIALAIFETVRLSSGALSGRHRTHISTRLQALAFASLGGTSFQGASLTGADFGNAMLKCTDFRRAILTNVYWRNAQELDAARFGMGSFNSFGNTILQSLLVTGNGEGMDYSGLNLSGMNLHRSNLRKANLEGVTLQEASLLEADLRGARLDKADLCRSDLRNADLTDASVDGVRIDLETCTKSLWAAVKIAELHKRGIEIVNLGGFPAEVQRLVLENPEGLLLSFATRLASFDRYLIDGVIFGVLGQETDCRVVEFKEQGDATIIRLQARHRQDLELVAEAIYRRVWEQEDRIQRKWLAAAPAMGTTQSVVNRGDIEQQINVQGDVNISLQLEGLLSEKLRIALSELIRSHLEKMELRESDSVVPSKTWDMKGNAEG